MKNFIAASLIFFTLLTGNVFGLATEPKDGPKYWDLMESSVRIKSEKQASPKNEFFFGSGTIIYSSNHKNYVLTCGHLFDGKINTCMIHIIYLNGKKLETVKEYKAQVVFLSIAEDVSLVFFTSDEKFLPYKPMAPSQLILKDGDVVESCGADGVLYKDKKYMCSYTVQIQLFADKIQTHVKNSPTPGRSGGGLMHKNMIIGVCSGNAGGTVRNTPKGKVYNYDGNGIYINVSVVKRLLKGTKHDWLCEVYKNKLTKPITINGRQSSTKQLPKPKIKSF